MKLGKRGLALLVAALLILASCSAGVQQEAALTPQPQSPQDIEAATSPATGLPAVASLPKASSSYDYIDPQSFLIAENIRYLPANAENTIPARLLLDPSMSIPPEDLPDGIEPRDLRYGTLFAYAIYQFSNVGDETASIQVSTYGSYDTPIWIGFADWGRGVWDFSAGAKVDSPSIALGSYLNAGKQIISPEGNVAIVVIVEPDTGTAALTSVRRLIIDDPRDFEASTDRWDGVNLHWSFVDGLDGYNVYRRELLPDISEWEQINEEIISQIYIDFLDSTALEGYIYEYRIEGGTYSNPGGMWQWFWSDGVTTTGNLGAQTVQVATGELSSFWPLTVYNQLGFAFDSAATSRVNLTVTDGFPPTGLWVPEWAGENGLNDAEVLSVAGLPTAVAFNHWGLYGNQRLTYGYSTVDGSFVQVAFIDTEGNMGWAPPVQVRAPDTLVLGIVDIPRRLGMITWNISTQQLEILDSIDQHGSNWYDWDPETYSWMIASDKQPEGAVEAVELDGSAYITYRQAETGSATILRFKNNRWSEVSPDILIGPDPKLRFFMVPPTPGKLAFFHLDEAQQRISFVTSNMNADWVLGFPITPVNLAGTGDTISEFDIHLFGSVSQRSYLAYIVDGDLYLSYSNTTSMLMWETPLLIDNSGDCRDLKIWRIGTDIDYNYRVYATYISDDDEGIQRIHFRELNQAIQYL